MRFKPKNYKCTKCETKQYTNQKCYGCGGKVFVDLNNNNINTLTLTDEELDIIQNWGFIVSTERPLSEKDRDLYFKITNA